MHEVRECVQSLVDQLVGTLEAHADIALTPVTDLVDPYTMDPIETVSLSPHTKKK